MGGGDVAPQELWRAAGNVGNSQRTRIPPVSRQLVLRRLSLKVLLDPRLLLWVLTKQGD